MMDKANDKEEWASKVLRGLWSQTQYAIQLSYCKLHLKRMCIHSFSHNIHTFNDNLVARCR
jgi:hypothetical protein